jgi:predicted dithiol-disulfide oxidoreductase (DUF899 family)
MAGLSLVNPGRDEKGDEPMPFHDVRLPNESDGADGTIRQRFVTKLMLAPEDPSQNPRHVDAIWPLWNLFDFMPEGRGETWHPRLAYGKA